MPPQTLEECFPALDAMLGDEDKEFLRQAKDIESAATYLHHSLGRHLRNEWNLWFESDLAKHISEKYKIEHPDDMSHFIIVRYVRNYPTAWDRLREESEA